MKNNLLYQNCELPINDNPYLSDLNNFTFGISNSCPEILKIFPQDLRIDMCTDIINEELNVD